MAEEAARAVGASSVLFVPTGRNPLKASPTAADAEDRLAMVQAAVAGNERFRVSDGELADDGPSFTEETVGRLVDAGALNPHPWLLIGDDLLPDLPRWRNVERLLRRIRLVVVSRCDDVEAEEIVGRVAGDSADVVVVRNPIIPISSRDVRTRLREGRSVRYLVPETVYEYICSHRLYQRPDPS